MQPVMTMKIDQLGGFLYSQQVDRSDTDTDTGTQYMKQSDKTFQNIKQCGPSSWWSPTLLITLP